MLMHVCLSSVTQVSQAKLISRMHGALYQQVQLDHKLCEPKVVVLMLQTSVQHGIFKCFVGRLYRLYILQIIRNLSLSCLHECLRLLHTSSQLEQHDARMLSSDASS